jgi:hypothetical protein
LARWRKSVRGVFSNSITFIVFDSDISLLGYMPDQAIMTRVTRSGWLTVDRYQVEIVNSAA